MLEGHALEEGMFSWGRGVFSLPSHKYRAQANLCLGGHRLRGFHQQPRSGAYQKRIKCPAQC